MDEYFDNLHKQMAAGRTAEPTTTTERLTMLDEPGKTKVSVQGRKLDAPETATKMPSATKLPTTKTPKTAKLHKGDEVVGSSKDFYKYLSISD